MPKKPINLRIDGQLLGQLKNLAEDNQTSLTNVIESFCQYGLQQDIEISKDGVFITVNTIDEDQLQQKIQQAVDTTVETKIKTVEDRLDAAIAPVLKRLESLERKLHPLEGEDVEIFKRQIDRWRQKQLQANNSNENKLQRGEAVENGQSPQEVDQGGKEGKCRGDNGSQQPKETGKGVSPQQEGLAAENRGQLNNLSSDRLRDLCTEYGIKWSHAYGRNKHLKKAEMVEAILKRLNC